MAFLQALSNGVGSLESFILDLLIAIFKGINLLLEKGISLMGDSLTSFLSVHLSTGGPGVFAVWQVIRDICNIAFLAIMVLVAFGTIFNAVWKNPFHYSSSLFRIIVAAVLINFSLAFGQLIVGLGNGGSDIVLHLLGPEDVGKQIAASIGLTNIVTGQFGDLLNSATFPVPASVSFSQLSADQQLTVQSWFSKTSDTQTGAPTEALNYLKDCLNNYLPSGTSRTPAECLKNADAYRSAMLQQAADEKYGQQAASTSFVSQLGSAVTGGAATGTANAFIGQIPVVGQSLALLNTYLAAKNAGKTPAEVRSDSDPSTRIAPLLSSILTFFMLLVLGLSFFVIVLFMIVRILYIWMLLAVSAGAFLAYAWPYGGGQAFNKWFKNLLGWSIFGSMYLFNIYLGLYVLSKQGPLIASLGAQNLPFWATIGSLFMFMIGCSIFVGGAAFCMSVSSKLGSGAGGLFGTIGGYLGVSEKTGFGISTVRSRLGRVTGVTPAYEAARGRLKQEGERARAAIRGRFGIGLTDEEALARARQRFGVTEGGAVKVAEQVSANINKREQELEKQMKGFETEIAAAATAARAANEAFDEKKALKDRQIA
ncbi:MAG TPA: hypothetical protein VMJ72_03260, partial [Candidatus Paceibacterota bacterium]|nr:hypothetical protein [Candidatus Paceibacterota bacterium]